MEADLSRAPAEISMLYRISKRDNKSEESTSGVDKRGMAETIT